MSLSNYNFLYKSKIWKNYEIALIYIYIDIIYKIILKKFGFSNLNNTTLIKTKFIISLFINIKLFFKKNL